MARSVGRLKDVVVHWTTRGAYPRVKAIVVRTGKRDVLIGARWLEASPPPRCGCGRPGPTRARSSAIPATSPWPTMSWIVRSSTRVGCRLFALPTCIWRLWGTGSSWWGSKLGSVHWLDGCGRKPCASASDPARVIDWASISAFASARPDGEGHRGRRSDIAGEAGAGLALDRSAEVVKRLTPTEIQAALDAAQANYRGESA